jgi:hypothetical protein
MKTVGPYYLEPNECAVSIRQNDDGSIRLSILNGAKIGMETMSAHHVARDLVRFLQGRPIDEFVFDYKTIEPMKPKRRLVLVQACDEERGRK